MKFTCEQVVRAGLGEPVKGEGTELLYPCPHPERHQHGDAHPSLKINPKKDTWGCFVCGVGGTAWQLAAFLAGVDASDKKAVTSWLREHGLIAKRAGKANKADGRGPCVGTYTYTDAQGNPIARKSRYEPGAGGKPKDYLWERLQNDKWVPGLGDPPLIPPLYKLPQIKDAPLVFVFESNPDVDLACSMEMAATTSGGCNSWRHENTEFFRDKCVCVVPDNDGPGAGYAAIVCASLYGKVNSLKVVSVAPEKDFTRWIQAGANTDKLLDLWEAAPEWKPATGAEILGAVMGFIRRFVSLSEAQARAVPLWVAHTHAFDAADFTPYLNVNSAEKESGKTRLLEVSQLLVATPWSTQNASPAAIVRKIHGDKVTALFDERDAFFGGDKERAETVRGILNSGFERGGHYTRCVGEGAKMTVVDFETFCPKAIAGIGRLSDTTASRSIPIRMKRAPRRQVTRFRKRDAELQREASEIFGKLAAWCKSNLETLRQGRPQIPDALSDRQADVCEPLLAIADLAGGTGDKPCARRLLNFARAHKLRMTRLG